MKWKDVLLIAQDAIKSNRLRTNLTISIIAVGISALLGILTVIKVLEWNIYNNFSGMGANTFTIMNLKSKSGRSNSDIQYKEALHYEEAKLFKQKFEFPSIVSISCINNIASTVSFNNKKTNPNVMTMSIDENYLYISSTNLSVGRNYTINDIQSNRNICILGNSIAKKIFDNVQQAIGSEIQIDHSKYVVIGVMESKGASFINRMDNTVFIPHGIGIKNYSSQNQSYVITVLISQANNFKLAMSEAEGAMRNINKIRPNQKNNFAIHRFDELANLLLTNIRYITLAAAVIGMITLLGAAIGLMNIMLVTVADRTREIGLTKSLGATNRIILQQFLAESILISFKGGIIGIFIGILLGNLLSLAFHTPFIIPWLWILFGFLICFLVGLLAGILPAYKASKLNPIDSLRYE